MKNLSRARQAGTLTLVLALLAGCGGDYAAEKMSWKADRLKKTISLTPEGTPPGLFVKAREAYEEILRRYPKSAKALTAQLSIGEVYAIEKNFELAEANYRKALEKYPENEELGAEVTFAIAQLKEKQGRPDEAMRLYSEITTKYEASPTALKVPLFLARREVQAKNVEMAKKYYQDAIGFYEMIETKYPKSRLALASLDLHSQCYGELGQWQDVLRVLKKIADDYPKSQEGMRAVSTRIQIMKGLEQQKSKAQPKDASPSKT